MKLERIIDIIGKNLNETFIVKRVSKAHPVFKVYNHYNIEVYKKDGKDFTLYFGYEDTFKTNGSKSIGDIEETFLQEFIKNCYGDKVK